VISVVFDHASLVYAGDPFHWIARDPDARIGAWPVIRGVSFWRMPLMFWIAGVSMAFLLRSRTVSAFVRERDRRLLVPLVTGMVVAVPLEAVMSDAWSVRGIEGPVAYGKYVAGSVAAGPPQLYNPWFLQYLLFFSAITAAVVHARRHWWRGNDGQRRLAPGISPAMLPVWGLIPAATQLVPVPWPLTGLWHLGIEASGAILFGAFLILGWFMAFDASVRTTSRDFRLPYAVAFTACTALMIAVPFAMEAQPGSDLWPVQRAARFVERPLGALTAWFGILTCVGFGERHLNFASPVLPYLRDATIPLYVVHEAIVVTTARATFGWDVPLPLKYLVLVTVALAVNLCVYEVAIRRFRIARFAFGLGPDGPASALVTLREELARRVPRVCGP
jgi:hypothetical protein